MIKFKLMNIEKIFGQYLSMIATRRSNFNISYQIWLIQPQQYFFTKHQIKSFMLYMRISQNIFIIAVQNSPQNLPVYFILLINDGIFFVNAKEFNHMKASLGLIEGYGKYFQSFIVVLGWKSGKISIKDLNNEFGNICCLSFLFLGLLNEQREDSIKRFYELSGIKNHLLIFFIGRWCYLLWIAGNRLGLKSTSVI